MSAYTPHVGSTGARAVAYFAKQPAGFEISTSQLAVVLDANQNSMSALLATAIRHKALVRVQRNGQVYWRLGEVEGGAPPEKPPRDDESADRAPDLAVKQVRVDASAVPAPIAAMTQQSWCPAAQDSLPESSLDEPPAPPPPSPAPALGLGWKAPRVPVYIGEPPAPAEVLLADVEAAEDDPDFREVERAPAPPGPDSPPNGAEAAQAPVSPQCGRDGATPNDGVVSQGKADPFRCALWSNGMLEILTTEGEIVLLNQDDTRRLMRYVSDSLSARARAAA